MSVSLGLGLTSRCDLACSHCYRPRDVLDLSREDVSRACDALDVAGVNLGTGENALHPMFREILADLFERQLRVSLVSNGLSIAALPDDVLRRLHEVEISIDFSTPEAFDAFRGPGAWQRATGALHRLRDLGVQTTVLAVMMRANHRDLAPLARVAAAHGAPLRVNVHQPVHGDEFTPTPAEFWSAIQDLATHTTWLGCSEPVIMAAAGLPGHGAHCGKTSVRITPGGDVLPCVYWPRSVGRVDDLVALGSTMLDQPAFKRTTATPAECRDCELLDVCGGGCTSRRALTDGLDRRDPLCPKTGFVTLPLRPRLATAAERLHLGNVCTLLVQG